MKAKKMKTTKEKINEALNYFGEQINEGFDEFGAIYNVHKKYGKTIANRTWSLILSYAQEAQSVIRRKKKYGKKSRRK